MASKKILYTSYSPDGSLGNQFQKLSRGVESRSFVIYFRFQHYLSKMASSCPLTDDNQTENDETNEEDELDPRVQVTY